MQIVKMIIGSIVGAIAGFAMYRFVGCQTGACPITSNPWSSIIFGMIVGAIAGMRI